MKKYILLLSAFIFMIPLGKAQTASDSLKSKLSKKWSLSAVEEFGVEYPPSETQKNDEIELKKDQTCTVVENGKKYTGTWSLDKSRTYIICNLNSGSIKRQYKIISVKDEEAVFEYQSPDLVRTKYKFLAK
jgi:hypothetical protein